MISIILFYLFYIFGLFAIPTAAFIYISVAAPWWFRSIFVLSRQRKRFASHTESYKMTRKRNVLTVASAGLVCALSTVQRTAVVEP